MGEFGKFWSKDEYEFPDRTLDFVEWYKWMYDSRIDINSEIIKWTNEKSDEICSIADFGCGIGVGFSEAFSDKKFIGLDISERNINWCNNNYNNSKHSYVSSDFSIAPLAEKVDLVICNGTLENVLDINKAMESMVLSSNKWIYAAGCSGWHPSLKSHKYDWREEWGCNSSLISPIEAKNTLKALGCEEINIFPFKQQRGCEDTIIIARVGDYK